MGAPAKKNPRGEPPLTESPARLVYTQAPVALARVLERVEDGWRVQLGAAVRVLPADDCVDPALLEEALESGARVVVDASEAPVIVGVIATRRALQIDREGAVAATVRSFVVDAKEEVLLKVPGAFVRAKERGVELYGERVLTRARYLAKILAAMIKLN